MDENVEIQESGRLAAEDRRIIFGGIVFALVAGIAMVLFWQFGLNDWESRNSERILAICQEFQAASDQSDHSEMKRLEGNLTYLIQGREIDEKRHTDRIAIVRTAFQQSKETLESKKLEQENAKRDQARRAEDQARREREQISQEAAHKELYSSLSSMIGDYNSIKRKKDTGNVFLDAERDKAVAEATSRLRSTLNRKIPIVGWDFLRVGSVKKDSDGSPYCEASITHTVALRMKPLTPEAEEDMRALETPCYVVISGQSNGILLEDSKKYRITDISLDVGLTSIKADPLYTRGLNRKY